MPDQRKISEFGKKSIKVIIFLKKSIIKFTFSPQLKKMCLMMVFQRFKARNH